MRMHRMGLVTALVGVTLLAATPALATGCPNGTIAIDLHTGQDADIDGLDDQWTVVVPGSSTPVPAPIATVPFVGWRGNVGSTDTGPFDMGFRYPVLGDGRWLGDFAAAGTYTYEVAFVLDGCVKPTLSGEWDADNTIEIFLNGNPVGIASNPDAMPPHPWLSNSSGSTHPDADPLDGLIHPSCTPPTFRCDKAEDEFREIHPFTIDDPNLFNLGGVNVLTVRIGNADVTSGFLLTGGVETATPAGANVRCCAVAPLDPIPSLSAIGRGVLFVLLALVGTVQLRRML